MTKNLMNKKNLRINAEQRTKISGGTKIEKMDF